jgi:hypothetical protein
MYTKRNAKIVSHCWLGDRWNFAIIWKVKFRFQWKMEKDWIECGFVWSVGWDCENPRICGPVHAVFVQSFGRLSSLDGVEKVELARKNKNSIRKNMLCVFLLVLTVLRTEDGSGRNGGTVPYVHVPKNVRIYLLILLHT